MHTVGDDHEGPDALGGGLFPGQIAGGLFVLGLRAESGNTRARLEVYGVAGPHEAVARPVAQTQVLALLEDAERGRCLAHLERRTGVET